MRSIDELRRRRVLTQHVEPTDPTNPAGESVVTNDLSAQELVEHAMSEEHVRQSMTDLSKRAATYVRLRILDGGRRADIMRSEGWSRKQYEAAQSEAVHTLRKSFVHGESPNANR